MKYPDMSVTSVCWQNIRPALSERRERCWSKVMRKVLFAALTAIFSQPAYADEMRQIMVYLPEAPLLSSSSEGHPRYIHSITAQALEGCGFEATFFYTSWKRAQSYVQSDVNSIIIPLARTPEREAMFRWVVPTVPYQSAFATIGEPLNAVSDITPSMTIAVVSGTGHWDFLLAEGVNPDQLSEMTSSKPLIDMIAVGRIDAWFDGVPEIYYNHAESYLKPDIVVGDSIYLVDLYIAAGLNFPDDLAEKIHSCVSDFKETAAYAELIEGYLPGRTLSKSELGQAD